MVTRYCNQAHVNKITLYITKVLFTKILKLNKSNDRTEMATLIHKES